ncbi:hypothetical protein LB542_08180 [Mesorhizobium sp. BR1-1-9]|uniref:hypothetical protein n=1 Tax=unclassified Mesorhizobium TaxID=325217 RepID=UPI001CD0C169|nr:MULTISPECIES: hypothetical protein [unclassified Mesorhizobium]MBZ9870835.1 hypothetical protein [Mesorhizobium sp. BR1-1-9]MBZ9939609.1 hypothetical protein [Mesorhizobium sp. BR1-1-13]
MALEAGILFSKLQADVLSLKTFLALSKSRVKPEIGRAPMRRKQAAHGRDIKLSAAAQHISPAMQR